MKQIIIIICQIYYFYITNVHLQPITFGARVPLASILPIITANSYQQQLYGNGGGYGQQTNFYRRGAYFPWIFGMRRFIPIYPNIYYPLGFNNNGFNNMDYGSGGGMYQNGYNNYGYDSYNRRNGGNNYGNNYGNYGNGRNNDDYGNDSYGDNGNTGYLPPSSSSPSSKSTTQNPYQNHSGNIGK